MIWLQRGISDLFTNFGLVRNSEQQAKLYFIMLQLNI